MTLYHKDVFMPEAAKRATFIAMVRPSPHARVAATDDRYGAFELPTVVDTREGELFEAGFEGTTIVKLAYRFRYDDTRDIILVMDPRPSMPVIITAWINERDDDHGTLDRSRYATN